MMGSRHNQGFTLVEAALAIALVGMALTATLHILQASKLSAAHTRDQKTARVLALKTLGEIESGLRWDELEEGAFLSGTYAEDDYPGFEWELAIGDQSFSEQEEYDPNAPFDNWEWKRDREAEEESSYTGDDSEENENHEPYEKVRIRVTYPKYGDMNHELTLERWMPWDQVYRPEESEDDALPGADNSGGPDTGGTEDSGPTTPDSGAPK